MIFLKIAVATSLTFGTAANAAISVFTDRAAFLAAVGISGTDTFDNLTVGETPGPLSRTAGVYGYTATIGSIGSVYYPATFYPVSDDGSDIYLGGNDSRDTITLSGFGANVRAAGGFFFGTGLYGQYTESASISINVTDADGTITVVASNPNTGTFRGFLSTGSLSSMSFLNEAQTDVFGTLNNLTLASGPAVPTGPSVPEPATWALMIAGFGLVGAATRRRRQTVTA